MTRHDFNEYRTWLFDLDGTLVDSSYAHRLAYHETLNNSTRQITSDFQYDDYKGWSTEEVFMSLGFRDYTLETMIKIKQEYYRKYVTLGKISIFPGAVELLETLVNTGRTVSIVTGSSRASAILALDYLGIRPMITDLVTTDDVKQGKPAPDLYRCALSKRITRPVVAVEDSLAGVYAAQNAQLPVVHVHYDSFIPGTIPIDSFDSIVEVL